MKNRYALEEFLENCRSRDLIKAKLVLDHLEQIDEQEQRRVLFEVNRCPDDFGLPLLVHLATGHAELFDRYPALHETLLDKASNNPGTIVEKIGNDHPERRFYIDLAGELRLSQAVSRLLESIKNTSDIAVIRSILRSLGSIGDPSSAGTIGDFLRSEHKTLVETAVQALEKIATDEAMRLLAERLGADDEKDTSILDVFANVGSGFCL
ncbi:MAG: HEAT repeat domain-containing protein, partial [Proteobacteria bacterium]|nr:HEAT repeat domain-containing protein [Pseudomonadota bacterium]